MTTDLVPVDKTAASVLGVLENAKTWLATAVEMTGPEEIAANKAVIRTAETYARELNLSRDIQEDAQEMVRRFEYKLAKAIRQSQADGTLAVMHRGGGPVSDYVRDGKVIRVDRQRDTKPISPSVATGEHQSILTDMYRMADGVEPETFESALVEAKAEGNLSRANVVRKVKQANPTTRDARADLIAELAQQGYSSRQMPSKVGVTEESVRLIARDYNITIPADRSVVKTRRIDSTNVVVNTATALEGLVSGVELIDYAALDLTEVRQWATSLTDSMRTLNRFVKQIREVTQ